MNTVIFPALSSNIPANYTETVSKPSLFARFFNWCRQQEHNRLAWLAIALAGHGCVLTPVTLLIVALSGVHVSLVVAAMAAMGAALVTNLAAMPTRITIPVFALSVLADIVIAACAIVMI